MNENKEILDAAYATDAALNLLGQAKSDAADVYFLSRTAYDANPTSAFGFALNAAYAAFNEADDAYDAKTAALAAIDADAAAARLAAAEVDADDADDAGDVYIPWGWNSDAREIGGTLRKLRNAAIDLDDE